MERRALVADDWRWLMKIYDDTDGCENIATIIAEAREEKAVMIKSPSGELFVVRLASRENSTAYHLPDIDLGLTREEIVDYIREVRERQ
jgi:hypothetical protein